RSGLRACSAATRFRCSSHASSTHAGPANRRVRDGWMWTPARTGRRCGRVLAIHGCAPSSAELDTVMCTGTSTTFVACRLMRQRVRSPDTPAWPAPESGDETVLTHRVSERIKDGSRASPVTHSGRLGSDGRPGRIGRAGIPEWPSGNSPAHGVLPSHGCYV